MRVRHLLAIVHASAALHGPHFRPQPRRAALARGTSLPVGGQHPRHGVGDGNVAPLLAQRPTRARDGPLLGHH